MSSDKSAIIVNSESGWTSFRIEAVDGVLSTARRGRYLIKPYSDTDWVEVDRDTYLAALATAQHDRHGTSLEAIDSALQRNR